MSSAAYRGQATDWLIESGPAELDLLLCGIVFHPSSHNRSGLADIRSPDCAALLLDTEGLVVRWNPGAERMFGYHHAETVGHNVLRFDPLPDAEPRLSEMMRRAAVEGHAGNEGPQQRKDGSLFWANTIVLPIKDERGDLQGFGLVVRDFTVRHERERTVQQRPALSHTTSAETTIAGVLSGEFGRILEANDAFLALVGRRRGDLEAGRLHWPDLTLPEYSTADGVAHEETLLFGASTPVEEELIRQDGTRVRVQVVTAVLNLSPLRWIKFVQDLRERDRHESVSRNVTPTQDFGEIVGGSAAIRRVMGQVELVAPTDSTVLVLGETGTGKELVARAIHRLSKRSRFPFVTLNCAAIPTGLLESELFGYERGAFTGALSRKIGRFEMAGRGTLFLDEVGDIPLELQPKLLRALQEKSFERLGGTTTIPIDVRLVAATNRNLTQMMQNRLFRSDLYYRLKVFPITTPPLRERPEDIPMLARHFTRKYSERMERRIEKISTDTMKSLVAWTWPGNVRELENFVERSVILSQGRSLRAPVNELREDSAETRDEATLETVERDHILRVFRETGGVVSATAIRLGIPRTTLNAMMKKLGISRSHL
jgi:PAS domain S-box-containing protein